MLVSRTRRRIGWLAKAGLVLGASALLPFAVGAPALALRQVTPTMAIDDVTAPEGNVGTSTATFTVTLSEITDQTVTVNYATADDTATAGEDYTSTSGTATIIAGELSTTIDVQVIGDLVDEPDETFFVDLSDPTNATIDDGQGVGTISDDDTAPSVDSFSPLRSKVHASVMVFGSAFTGATSVTFGGVPVTTFTVVSDNQITTKVPFGASTGPIAVTTPAGTGTSGTDFLVSPRVKGFTPGSGSVGTEITILGQAFLDVTQVTFKNVPAEFTIDSYSQLRATVPAGATTGVIKVFNSAGQAKSKTNFVVIP